MNWNRNKRDVWHAIGARLIRSIVCAFHLCSCRHWSRIKALQMIVFDYQTVSSAVKDSNRFCIVLLGESWMMTTGYVLLRFRFLLLSSSSSSKVMTTHCCMPSREYCTLLLRTLSHPECSHFLSSSRTAVFFFCFCFLLSSCDSFAHTSVLLTRTWCPSADRWCRLLSSQLLFVLMSYFYYSSVRKWKTRETGSVRARKGKAKSEKEGINHSNARLCEREKMARTSCCHGRATRPWSSRKEMYILYILRQLSLRCS